MSEFTARDLSANVLRPARIKFAPGIVFWFCGSKNCGEVIAIYEREKHQIVLRGGFVWSKKQRKYLEPSYHIPYSKDVIRSAMNTREEETSQKIMLHQLICVSKEHRRRPRPPIYLEAKNCPAIVTCPDCQRDTIIKASDLSEARALIASDSDGSNPNKKDAPHRRGAPG